MQDRIVKRFFSASFFMWSSTVDKALQSVYFVILQIFKYSGNHINAVTNGSKKFGLTNGVDVLSGQAQIS